MTNDIYNLCLEINEIINHPNYNSNEVIEIYKYISEKEHSVINSIDRVNCGETQRLISPTGSGKSYTMVNKLKKFNIKSLFFYLIVSCNVEQIMKEYSIF